MRLGISHVLLSGMMFLSLPLGGQGVNMGRPEEMHAQKVLTAEDIRSRVSRAQFQKDAKELSELCASIPGDMDNLKRGLLSKDVVDRLKRVEKLSRRVREELTR